MYFFILIFILLPAAEIGVFIWTGSKIGALPVVLLIVLTGFAGATFMKIQGMETWRRMQLAIYNREVPREEVLDGICIILGGILLLSPGFITDTLGFLFLLPWTRKPLKRWLEYLITKRIAKGTITYRRW